MFGGAITINSPDFQNSKKPFVITSNNTFTKNMAYLSGSALYIRNTKRDDQKNLWCGGVSMFNDTFT